MSLEKRSKPDAVAEPQSSKVARSMTIEGEDAQGQGAVARSGHSLTAYFACGSSYNAAPVAFADGWSGAVLVSELKPQYTRCFHFWGCRL